MYIYMAKLDVHFSNLRSEHISWQSLWLSSTSRWFWLWWTGYAPLFLSFRSFSLRIHNGKCAGIIASQ